MTGSVFAACLMMAAQAYQVPPAVLVGILKVEGGKVGQEVGPNGNGTYDLGPMQINTVWLEELAGHWNTDKATARRMVRDDGCLNITVGAWILRRQMDRTDHLYRAIARYHSATPGIGTRYADKVVREMRRLGLVRP